MEVHTNGVRKNYELEFGEPILVPHVDYPYEDVYLGILNHGAEYQLQVRDIKYLFNDQGRS
ncbi:hypothetical protein [Chengkuizengella sediminis]|uniref:hypothetical protein n=1 Tax=Chengkuizengella sediminis TaxID=1885917 RepID=UPI001389E5C3|nr:hypothetical protein [Chengkuizengella sediminis]NDI34535.1 hypothetical protein [Chengkuizengella sediminis]